MFYEVDAMSTTIIMEPDVQQKLAILGGEASDRSAATQVEPISDQPSTVPAVRAGSRRIRFSQASG